MMVLLANYQKIFILTLSLIFMSRYSLAQTRISEIQAAFVYKFMQFIELPKTEKKYTKIYVVGDVDLKVFLERSYHNEKLYQKEVVVKTYQKSKGEVPDLVVVGSNVKPKVLASILSSNKYKKTLILTNAQDGLTKGSVINFKIRNKKVVFEINNKLAKDKGIHISSKLLRLAENYR